MRPSLAYLILCHKNPRQVIRLIERLREDDTVFVIHVDKRSNEEVYTELREYASKTSHVYFAERHRCYWGNFGIVRATISCIQAAIRLDLPFDYAFLLSGQDYPIKANAEIRSFLSRHQGAEFIESFRLETPNRWSNTGGYGQAMNRIQYWTVYVRSHCFQIRLKRRFPRGWTPYGGSQWWCLSKDCISYLGEAVRKNKSIVRYFKWVFVPDESFFQTLLSNSPFHKKIISADLRYVDWINPNPNYPRTLELVDLAKLKAASKIFARKVEKGRSDGLLDQLDRYLDNPERQPESDGKILVP
jgi:Core-2/I-Branching enzyme